MFNKLQLRSKCLQQIRAFFEQRGVLEVSTPALMPYPPSDPYLTAFSVQAQTAAGRRTLYLHTSPEPAMKALLADGSGCIYQICQAYRDDEWGRIHRPEFTMLEWYRLDFDDHMLMQEVSELLQLILNTKPANKISYQELFASSLQINPHTAKPSELKNLVVTHCGQVSGIDSLERDDYLQLLFSQVLEPKLGWHGPTIIYDYPATQAALARLKTTGPHQVAARFELFYQGIELANGYWELADRDEQYRRAQRDLAVRKRQGLEPVAIDQVLLSALERGLPNCAGIALGLDRLLMLAAGKKDLSDIYPG